MRHPVKMNYLGPNPSDTVFSEAMKIIKHTRKPQNFFIEKKETLIIVNPLGIRVVIGGPGFNHTWRNYFECYDINGKSAWNSGVMYDRLYVLKCFRDEPLFLYLDKED